MSRGKTDSRHLHQDPADSAFSEMKVTRHLMGRRSSTLFQSKQKKQLQTALEQLEAAQSRVSELEADWQAIQRSLPLAVMSRDGLFESVSGALLDTLGYQEQQLLGQHHRMLCEAGYDRSEDYIRFWRELVTGHVKEGRFLNVDSAGQNIWLESRYLPVLSEKEVVTRIILLASPAPAPVNAEPQ